MLPLINYVKKVLKKIYFNIIYLIIAKLQWLDSRLRKYVWFNMIVLYIIHKIINVFTSYILFLFNIIC